MKKNKGFQSQSQRQQVPAHDKQLAISNKEGAAMVRRAAPLPDPHEMEGYRNISPDFPERIVAMSENNNGFRIENVRLLTENEIVISRRAQIFAFIISIWGLSCSLILGLAGHETTAGIIGGTTLVGIVSAFIVGKITSRSE